ncbi:hypothetical protein VKT23_001231 [Stygiomarasmius scandens]|uniref:SHSP domain-containing protein n=1 Tax=Marasmiellus scandens TaxID=2682957 RepID=A0ABR1K6H7_9AGAR
MTARPEPQRTSSYSSAKRHASFGSAREVPLPSPNLQKEKFSYFPDMSSPRQSAFETPIDDRDPPTPQPVFPHPRPYSLPHTSSGSSASTSSSASADSDPSPSELYKGPGSTVDRSSSASLPLPNQLPFHALPKVAGPSLRLAHPLVSEVAKSRLDEEPPESEHDTPKHDLRTTRSLRDPQPFKSSRNSGNSFFSDSSHATALRRPLSSSSSSLPPPEPPTILPPPSPPSNMGTMTAQPKPSPPPSSTPNHTPPSMMMNANDLPPVLPPRSTPRSSNPPDPGRSSPITNASGSTVTTSSISPPGQQQQRNINGQLSSSTLHQDHNASPAYAPFLSHLPPPADSWIEVETSPTEYRLNVRLPGFKRDGITLATKRRRILHVVADSWENGGGHFERRISFGYDADLVQVRAEFDGEMLKVVVPRRASASGMMGMI